MRFGRKWALVAAVAALVAGLAWWLAAAGPLTAFRILYYNRTGIDDFEHFPSRTLRPASRPHTLPHSSSVHRPELERILEQNETVAFLVLRDGKIVFERYGEGHSKDSPSQSFSMAKSFLSALVGTAIADGYVTSVSDRVTTYVPELGSRGFGAVSIEDLLRMSSGSSYVEDENPLGVHARFTYTDDVEGEILKLRVTEAPGRWRYKSGDTAVLTLALDRALGPKTLTQYMQDRLWSPLGMEAPALWTVDHDRGLEKTWCCLAATARDYAKLGLLYLRHGRSAGRQVVPVSWVARSTRPGPSVDDHHRATGVWGYGYHWWLVSREDGDYLAAGHGGQYLYVHPPSGVVIVRLGHDQGELDQHRWLELFRSLVI